MKAIEITEPGKVCLSEREMPIPQAGEVLLKINRIGYCGSDLAAFKGLNPLVTYPRVPGHEIGATITELGEGVSNWSVGQEVSVIPYISCGQCSACEKERFNCCMNNETWGVQRDGALCEYATAPVEKLIASENLSLQELALVEPLTVGFHAVARGQVTPSDTVAVIGCGAIGLGVIAGANYRNARVIAIDIEDSKAAVAKACGATEFVNSRTENVSERLKELTAGHGPDVIIEAVGHPLTYQMAVEEVCFAGRVVYIGWAKAAIQYETKLFVLKELDIRGSRNALPVDFEAVIAMLEAGDFPLETVITKTVALCDAPAAMDAWAADPASITKIQINLDA
ncbi:MAG: zinc-binding alcohol dehydrogenase family protein [Mariniblastus sp.]|nr:zinc-binding alcohol dehydrogenase family protein [Mariniblastus sp.]